MEIIDKQNILNRITEIGDLQLELGCGSCKKHKDAIGIDVIDDTCVDIVGDVYDVLSRIPDNSVSAVYSYHFF
jgi:predicted SAM-dependent methyltransferase